jgi:membrane protease YdiL (CAAX protease family)
LSPSFLFLPKPLSRTAWLWLEFVAFFFCIPLVLWFHPTRWDGHVCLWLFSVYALYELRGRRGFSWRVLWNGRGWSKTHKYQALIRFICATAAIILFAREMAPYRLFTFPMQRPGFWLIVMILYPILSALPQELVFRSFFFRRYAGLFPGFAPMLLVNALCFGWIHVMFHNWVSPLLSVIAGALFALSYSQHRSLKWAALEHAAYGCMVFTVGIGFYFLVSSFRPV